MWTTQKLPKKMFFLKFLVFFVLFPYLPFKITYEISNFPFFHITIEFNSKVKLSVQQTSINQYIYFNFWIVIFTYLGIVFYLQNKYKCYRHWRS